MSAVEVKFTGWLALKMDARGSWRAGVMRLTKQRPALASDEIAVEINLVVPAALFEKPTLKIEAEIPADAAIATEIPAEVQDNIAEVIRDQTGLKVEIVVPEEEDNA